MRNGAGACRVAPSRGWIVSGRTIGALVHSDTADMRRLWGCHALHVRMRHASDDSMAGGVPFYVLTIPPRTPPFDRAIALACTLHTLRARWLHTRCRCGAAEAHPVRLALQGRAEAAGTLVDAVVRLRCTSCGGRPAVVHLRENG